MDYIEQQSKLFVGTNNCNILTIDIAPLLAENDMLSSPDPNSTLKKFGMTGLEKSINLKDINKLDLDRDTGVDLGEQTEYAKIMAEQKKIQEQYKWLIIILS